MYSLLHFDMRPVSYSNTPSVRIASRSVVRLFLSNPVFNPLHELIVTQVLAHRQYSLSGIA
jgi:hypothetical protein